MARIRSIHPGFFTDEDVVSVSFAARLLLIGLGVESDDKGVFLWKPKTLTMRIFPADNIDVVPLLDELIDADLVKSYEIDGRKYGAIRNFRKHQRPKKPNDVHPVPNQFRTYLGLSAESSEPKAVKDAPVPNQFRTGGENAIQMEDGGWRMDEKSKDFSSAGNEEKDFHRPMFNELLEIYPTRPNENCSKAYENFKARATSQEEAEFLVWAARCLAADLPERFKHEEYKQAVKYAASLANWLGDERYEHFRSQWNKKQMKEQVA